MDLILLILLTILAVYLCFGFAAGIWFEKASFIRYFKRREMRRVISSGLKIIAITVLWVPIIIGIIFIIVFEPDDGWGRKPQ